MCKYSVISLMLLIVACSGNTPDQAVNGFLCAMRDGDYESLIEHCPSLDSEIGDLTPSELQEEHPPQPDLEWEISGTEISINGKTAVVEVELGGSTLSFHCVQSNGNWVVGEIESQLSPETYQGVCRSQMRIVASQEIIYYAEHNNYTDSMEELGLANVSCSECGDYILQVSGQHFTVSCPGNHGSITDGEYSWE